MHNRPKYLTCFVFVIPFLASVLCSQTATARDPFIDRFWSREAAKGFGQQVEGLVGSFGNAAGNIQKLNREIKRKKRGYWSSFPHAAESSVQQEFDRLLATRDFYYASYALPTGPLTSMVKLFDITGNSLDGGIPPFAKKEFDQWVCAMREAEGITDHGYVYTRRGRKNIKHGKLLVLNAKMFAGMFEKTQGYRLRYQLRRDWFEYHASGHEQEFYASPSDFLKFWLWHQFDRKQFDSKINVNDFKAGQRFVSESLVEMARIYGRDNLLAATETVMRDKRDSEGRQIDSDGLGLYRMTPIEAVHELMRRQSVHGAIVAGHLFNTSDYRNVEAQIRLSTYLYGEETMRQVGKDLKDAERNEGESYWKVADGGYRYWIVRPGGSSRSISAAFNKYLWEHDQRRQLPEPLEQASQKMLDSEDKEHAHDEYTRLMKKVVEQQNMPLPFELPASRSIEQPAKESSSNDRKVESSTSDVFADPQESLPNNNPNRVVKVSVFIAIFLGGVAAVWKFRGTR